MPTKVSGYTHCKDEVGVIWVSRMPIIFKYILPKFPFRVILKVWSVSLRAECHFESEVVLSESERNHEPL